MNIDWSSYYNIYKIDNNDSNTYEYYEDKIYCTKIVKRLIDIYLTGYVQGKDFSNIDMDLFIHELPKEGPYGTSLEWNLQVNNELQYVINKVYSNNLLEAFNNEYGEQQTNDLLQIYSIMIYTYKLPIALVFGNKVVKTFTTNGIYESNSACPICKQIDKLFVDIFDETDNIRKQSLINMLDNNFLVDGYNLLPVLENFGNKQKMNKIVEYKSLLTSYDGDVSSNINKPRLIHSRWCNVCGSRKYDIYSDWREIDD